MNKICVFGDSIAWGAIDPQYGGWVALLKNYFQDQNIKNDTYIQVYNLGVSGDTSADLLKRFANEVDARAPDIIIFAIGINDTLSLISLKHNRILIDEFTKNVTSMVETTLGQKRAVLIVGLSRVDESKTRPWDTDVEYCNEEIEKYDAILKEISRQNNIQYIDLSKVISLTDLADGLHPNSLGHQKIFELVRDTLGGRTSK